MDASYRLILCLILCSFSNSVFSQDSEEPRIYHELNFLGNETIIKQFMKPEPLKGIDLTFPGCGFRSPKIQGTSPSPSESPEIRRDKRSLPENDNVPDDETPALPKGVHSKPWPWMVAIFEEHSERKFFACGGSLISQKYVLTAAQCLVRYDEDEEEFFNIDPSEFSVVIGQRITSNGTGEAEYPVKEIKVHPGYQAPELYHDIALIELERPVKLSKKLYPVCLPSDGLKNKIQGGISSVTEIGWRYDEVEDGVREKLELREVTIRNVPLKECQDFYSKHPTETFRWGITEQHVCAGVTENGKRACTGDTGGPLVSKLKDNSYVQLGISISNFGCLKTSVPGVRTGVLPYTKWIYDNTDLGK